MFSFSVPILSSQLPFKDDVVYQYLTRLCLLLCFCISVIPAGGQPGGEGFAISSQ